MPKDDPIRNPRLSPAGLPPGELGRHHAKETPRSPGISDPEICRFISSYGGVVHCQATVFLGGFCQFHHGCLTRGEISPLGRILDVVEDQERRREINLYGIDLPALDRLPEDPVTGGSAGRQDP